jgi:pentapeptide MXKDX repeat protein
LAGKLPAFKRGAIMKKFAVLVCAAALLASPGAAYAQAKMKDDKGMMQDDKMKKDTMMKDDKMKKDDKMMKDDKMKK